MIRKLILLAGLTIAPVLASCGPDPVPDFIANMPGDEPDHNPGDGFCSISPYLPGPDLPDCTLRAAVMEANANDELDYFQIESGLVIELFLSGSEEDNAETGDLDILQDLEIGVDFLEPATIDAFALGDRVFEVHEDVRFVVSDLVIRGGSTDGDGGGIYHHGSWLELESVHLEENSAARQGGGLLLAGAAQLDEVELTGNTANGGDVDGLAPEGEEPDDADMCANTGGGGIYVRNGAEAKIGNSVIQRNWTNGLGGGIANNGGEISIENDSYLLFNAVLPGACEGGGQGAGIYNGGHSEGTMGTLSVSDTEIMYNFAPFGSGGALRNGAGGSTDLDEVLIESNFAEYGAGINNSAAMSVGNNVLVRYNGDTEFLENFCETNVASIQNYCSEENRYDADSLVVDRGGGIDHDSDETIAVNGFLEVAENYATFGAGIANSGYLDLFNMRVASNGRAQEGGGLYNGAAGVVEASTEIEIYLNGAEKGGGIYNHGTLLISGEGFDSGVVISENSASDGGGIYNDGLVFEISGLRIEANQAEGSGGGVFSSGDEAALIMVSITGNRAASQGGGILNAGTISIQQSMIADNHADGGIDPDESSCSGSISGGGIYTRARGVLSIEDSTIEENSAIHLGGGIANNGSTITIESSTISDNLIDAEFCVNEEGVGGGQGGGIYNGGTTDGLTGSLAISNSTVSGNGFEETGGVGGGIVVASNGQAFLSYVTLAENYADGSGGLLIHAGARVTIANSILALNMAGGTDSDCTGELISQGFNLVGSDFACLGLEAPLSDSFGTRANPLDPGLAARGNNGGPTETYALQASSPAIDRANPEACPATDQRSVTRPQQENCDIGAFELEP